MQPNHKQIQKIQKIRLAFYLLMYLDSIMTEIRALKIAKNNFCKIILPCKLLGTSFQSCNRIKIEIDTTFSIFCMVRNHFDVLIEKYSHKK